MGRLSGIARREKKRAPMETLDSAEISMETGVADDSRGKQGKRQVTPAICARMARGLRSARPPNRLDDTSCQSAC